jgi:hypothetical protein
VGRFRLPHPIGYVTVMSLLQILLGMLPMLAFFKIAFHHENTLMVKAAQMQLARDLQARAQDLWARIGSPEPPSDPKAAALAVPDRQALYERRLTNSWDTYYRFFYDTRVDWNTRAAVNPFANRPSRGDLIDAGLAYLRPHYNEQDVLTRSVANPAAADGAWWWTNRAGGGISTDRFESSTVTNRVGRLVYTKTGFHLPPDGTAHTLSIDSAEPRWPGFSFVWFWPFLLLFCLPLLITFIIADKVLLLRIRPPAREATSMLGPDPHPGGAPFGPGRYLLLGPARSGKSLLLRADRFASLEPGKFHRVDLRRADDQKWLEPEREDELLAATDRAIVVDHLDHDLDAPAFNHKKLRFLERLLRDERRTVVLVSNVHPLHFAMGESSAGRGDNEQGTPSPSTSDVNAWVDALMAFKNLYCHRRCTDASPADPEGHILPDARALYRSVWMICSPVEQEILHQVAQRRLISSYLPELPCLLDRGLLRRNPALTLFSHGFQHFVLSAYRPGAPIPGVPSGATNLWQSLKGPAVTVLVILAGFLVATQQDLWQNTVAWGTAFVGGIGVFAKVFEVLQQARLKREAER